MKPDIINETWIDPDKSTQDAYQIPGYCLLRFDRPRCGGGNAVYYNERLAVSLLKDVREHEYAWLKIRVGETLLLAGHCYRPPSTSNEIFSHLADDDIDSLIAQYPNAVLMLLGDLNVHRRGWLPGTCNDNEAG